jgi:hypothetical protein
MSDNLPVRIDTALSSVRSFPGTMSAVETPGGAPRRTSSLADDPTTGRDGHRQAMSIRGAALVTALAGDVATLLQDAGALVDEVSGTC